MRKRSFSILALVIAGLITVYFSFMMWTAEPASDNFHYTTTYRLIQLPEGDTAFGGIFSSFRINDSLPHYAYQLIADSLKKINDERQQENGSMDAQGNTLGPLGVYDFPVWKKQDWNRSISKQYIAQLDSVTNLAYKKIAATTNKDSIQKIKDQLRDTSAYYNSLISQETAAGDTATDHFYYFGLHGYVLNKDAKFFIQNGTYNLAYIKLDTIIKNKTGSSEEGHYERKQIPVRYATEKKRLLIPVSRQQYNVLNIVVGVVSISLIFAALYFFLGLPILILISISKGRAFDDMNIRRFSIMARLMLAVALINVVLPYVL
ncbi:MAG TPA: hypothetical protein VF008_00755, partial [Niastella sp.]